MTTQSQVVVASVANDAELPSAFSTILRQSPALLPQTLPPTVVIKPNLCDSAAWETGVTTDPIWIGILAKELRARRSDVRILIVESDAISAYREFRSCEESFARLGYVEAAREAGVKLVNLSKEESWEVQVPTFPEPIRIPALFLENFFFISAANVKLHPYDSYTGILKNNYGLLPQHDRTGLHFRLSEILFTLDRLCPTDLAILDGRIGLEGRGPILGRPKRLNRLIVGNDALAVDQIACRLIALNPDKVLHLRHAARQTKSRPDPAIIGDLTPQPFKADDAQVTKIITCKFTVRRWHWHLERTSLRVVAWWFQARRNPWQFFKRIVRKFLTH